MPVSDFLTCRFAFVSRGGLVFVFSPSVAGFDKGDFIIL
jgi:hypothetical protein